MHPDVNLAAYFPFFRQAGVKELQVGLWTTANVRVTSLSCASKLTSCSLTQPHVWLGRMLQNCTLTRCSRTCFHGMRAICVFA